MRYFFVMMMIAFAIAASMKANGQSTNPYYSRIDSKKLNVSDKEWEKILDSEVYKIAREQYTERAFTGEYYKTKTKGTYYCAVCGNALFSSSTKFESNTGWPSFYQPLKNTSVTNKKDKTHGMSRTEVVCARCNSHLGHVFDDGPKPTGLRYCMNSAVLELVPDKK